MFIDATFTTVLQGYSQLLMAIGYDKKYNCKVPMFLALMTCKKQV
jgi:hypothetical protein